jgi:hypothetical protein
LLNCDLIGAWNVELLSSNISSIKLATLMLMRSADAYSNQRLYRLLYPCVIFCTVSSMVATCLAQDKIDRLLGDTPLTSKESEPDPDSRRGPLEQMKGLMFPERPHGVLRELLAGQYSYTILDRSVHAGISGRVTPAFLYGDNGQNNGGSLVDNNNAGTRIVGVAEVRLNEHWTTGGRVKLPIAITSSVDTNFDDSRANISFGDFGEGELSGYLGHQRIGRFSFGYGDTASDGTSEMDLSGTVVISRSRVRDLAGGMSFKNNGPQIKAVFFNYDGLGDQPRLRYDSPYIADVRLSASHTTDQDLDAAVRWHPKIKDRRIAVAGSIVHRENGDDQISLSGSVLWNTGINFTAAIAGRNVAKRKPLFFYGKVGWIGRKLPWGPTAVALDAAYNRDSLSTGDEAVSVGGFAVQTIEKDGIVEGLDLYIGVRLHHYESNSTDYGDILAMMTGLRVRF